MTTYDIAVLAGDGIGPEVTAEAARVLTASAKRFGFGLSLRHYPIGAAAVAVSGNPLPEETRVAAVRADAVLLGAVGLPAGLTS